MNFENNIQECECAQTDFNSEKDKDSSTVVKQTFAINKKDILFAVGAVVCCVFTALFGIFNFALGYTLSTVMLTVLISLYFVNKQKIKLTSVFYGLLTVMNSAVFISTTNASVKFFAVIIIFLLCIMFFDGFINTRRRGNKAVINTFYSAFSSVGNILISVKSLFDGNGSKKVIKVFIGMICAIPMLIIIVPLLISSDDAFSGLVENIFSNSFNTILKIILGLGMSLIVISYGFSVKKGLSAQLKPCNFKGVENIYVISFLSVISACYLLYLFSQLAYFFSAFSGILPSGYKFNVSQYARKGFFEMCVIAVINLAVTALCILLSKKYNGKLNYAIKAFCTFISVFTLIIIATAVSKMVLYIKSFGMTVLRITTSSFMLFLAIVFISVILRIYISKINVLKTAIITAGCVIFVLGTVNVNAVSAKYNYEAYKTGRLKNIDIYAMYELGDEGIPYITKLACSKKPEIAKEAQYYLSQAYLYDYFDNNADSQSFTVDDLKEKQKYKGIKNYSIPKAEAYNSLYKFIEKNPSFSSSCQFLVNFYEW